MTDDLQNLLMTLAAHIISAEKVVAEIAACAKDRAADAPEWNDSDTVQITVSINTLRHALAAYDSLTTPSAPAPQST